MGFFSWLEKQSGSVEGLVQKADTHFAQTDKHIADIEKNLGKISDSRTAELAGTVAKGVGGAAKGVGGAASRTYSGAKAIVGKSAFVAALVGAAVAAPFILNGMRNSKRYPQAAPLPPEPPPLPLMMDPTANTMMGMQPVEGPMTQRVLAQRSGANAGIDPTNPGLMDVDGSGQQPQALGR